MTLRARRDSVKVYIVEPHEIYRYGVRIATEEHPELQVVGEATSIDAGVRDLALSRAGVVVVGIRAHESEVVRDLPRLRQLHPHCAVVVVARRPDDRAAALRAGAAVALSKDVDASELMRSVAAAATEQRLTPRRGSSAAPATTAPAGRPGPAGIDQLTPQERRVLALIGEGLTNREIASQLFLAEKTVRNHVTRLLAKLGATRRTQAALIAARQG